MTHLQKICRRHASEDLLNAGRWPAFRHPCRRGIKLKWWLGAETARRLPGRDENPKGNFSGEAAWSGACDYLVNRPQLWYPTDMRRNAKSITTSPEIVRHIHGLTEANFNLLIKLIEWLTEKEKAAHKFRLVVLSRLSKLETTLTEIQGAQLAEYWSPEKRITDEQRKKYIQEVEERISRGSEQLGLKMVKFIYGEDRAPEPRHDRRRKWHGWEV
jgi:hypothetical protein